MSKTQKFVAKSYKLKSNNTPLAYMLSSHHSKRSNLLHFDEGTGTNRPLRYARNQKSPFEDEQDGNVIMEPIIFEDGFLHVPKNNQVLQQFLSYHPGNGQVFEEINDQKDAAEDLEMENIALDAQIAARSLDLDKLVQVGRVLLGSDVDTLSTAELKRDILVYSRNYPNDFMEVINDPTLQVQEDVVLFFQNQMITLRNNGKDVYFNLKDNKKKLIAVPYGEDAEYILADYFQSDDGLEIYKYLKKILKKK
tara:strand:+ start:70 stop:822 length:753 start_codon:yes stop_codon:yes gene_type:complete